MSSDNRSINSSGKNAHPLKSVLLGTGILLVGIAVAVVIVKSAPKPQRVKPETKARLVEVAPLQRQSSAPLWTAGGQVMSAQQVQLKPQVAGRIIELADAAVPGARLNKGDLLARIDPADFKLTVQQREAALIQAQASLDIEKGQASLAREEYELSQAQLSAKDKALVLRQPQIAQAKAAVKTAQANLSQAKLNLQRADIRMPFNGQINARSVSVGSQVSVSSNVFDLVNVEQFWIEVKIPAAFLPWLDRQQVAQITQSGWLGKTREANILNVLPAVDNSDRQVKLILALTDPLGLDNPELPPVLLNDFVEVQLQGRALENSYQIASRYLNDNNEIWVVNNNQLEKSALDVIYQGREYAWINAEADQGFQPDDRILISRIDAPVTGYPVRILGEEASDKPADRAQRTSAAE